MKSREGILIQKSPKRLHYQRLPEETQKDAPRPNGNDPGVSEIFRNEGGDGSRGMPMSLGYFDTRCKSSLKRA